MHEDILERILNHQLPRIFEDKPRFQAQNSGLVDKKRLISGTSVIAFQYKDGVLMAADRKTSVGADIKFLDTIKIHQVAEYTGVGFAGIVSEIQSTLKQLKNINTQFMSRCKKWLTIEGQVNYMMNFLCQFPDEYFMGYLIDLIIVGRGFHGETKIYSISSDKCCYQLSYATIGSGENSANSVLFDHRKAINDKSLSQEEAIELALKALFKSGTNDNYTSDIRVVAPNIAVITSEGFKFIKDDIVKTAIQKLVQEEEVKDAKK